MGQISGDLCTRCKGVKNLCGAKRCPLLLKRKYLKEEVPKVKKRHLQVVSRPDFLVGEYGYPNVNIGPLSSPTKINIVQKDPKQWAVEGRDMTEILKLRLSTLYSREKRRVKDARKRRKIQEMSISTKPLDVEIGLKKRPRATAKLDSEIPPVGLSGELERIDIVDNISAPRKLETAVEENARVSRIAPELWKHDIGFYKVMRLLSTGMLGRKKDRKFVPTRWAITATDSILGDYFLDQINKYSTIGTGKLYFRNYLGNLYYLMLVPSECWRMEMFEIWLPNSVWTDKKPSIYQIHEDYEGDPTKMDGGYYAIRYGVLEHLAKIQKKAAILAVRIITPNYFAPVGSWQIRESVRLALQDEHEKEGRLTKLLSYVTRKEGERINIDLARNSWLLKRLKNPTLEEFFTA